MLNNRTFTILVAMLLALILGVTFLGLNTRKKLKPTADITTNMARGFDAKATIKMKGLVMEGDINRTDNGACTIMVKEPKHLKGMSFAYNGRDVTVGYKGMVVVLDENSKMVSSATVALANAINKATQKDGISVGIDGKVLVVKGDTESGQFKIRLDKKTGSMLSLNMEDIDFECNFDDFVFSGKK